MGPGPEMFVPTSDEGARGNNGRGPGTTVNPDNTQFNGIEAFFPYKRAIAIVFSNFPLDFNLKKKKVGTIQLSRPNRGQFFLEKKGSCMKLTSKK